MSPVLFKSLRESIKDVVTQMKKKIIRAAALALAMLTLLGVLACAAKTPYSDISFKKYIKLGDLAVSLERSDIDAAVQSEIQSFLKTYAETETVDREIKFWKDDPIRYDNVTVDTVCYVINEQNELVLFDDFAEVDEGVSANLSGYTIEHIGNGDFREEIENALEGAKTLDEKWAYITYDDTIETEALKNQRTAVKITVKKIEQVTLPDYCDQFIASKTEYSTVSEFEAELTYELTLSLMWQKFIDSCEIKKYPDEKVQPYQKEYCAVYESYAKTCGLELSAFLSSYYGITVAELEAEALQYAQNTVKEELALYYIVKKKGIRFSEEEYKSHAESILDYYECKDIDELEEKYTKETVERDLYWKLVKELMYEKLTVTEAQA